MTGKSEYESRLEAGDGIDNEWKVQHVYNPDGNDSEYVLRHEDGRQRTFNFRGLVGFFTARRAQYTGGK